MALYLDSANLDDVRRALELGFVTGVTTNPGLIAKTGCPGLDILKDILGMTNGPIFYQVTAETAEGRADQAREAFSLAPEQLMIKIPATTENLSLTTKLVAEGVKCCITAVFHPSQTYLAVLAGASYTIVYVNRLTRELGDGIATLRECVSISSNTPTRMLAASLKSVDEVVAAAQAGADDLTVPLDVILALGDHPLSHKAIEDFNTQMRAAQV